MGEGAGSRHWPLEGLRLEIDARDHSATPATPAISALDGRDVFAAPAPMVLRPVRDEDLDALTDAMTDDIEMNPHTPRPFGLPERGARAAAMRQEHWKSLADWSPDDWNLGFVVERGGLVVGLPSL